MTRLNTALLITIFFICGALSAAQSQAEVKISGLPGGAVMKREPVRLLISGVGAIITPDCFEGARYICMPRGLANQPGSGYSFTINRDSDIYIMVHRRGTPAVDGWEKTKLAAIWHHATNIHDDYIYKKHFKAGKVVIPPHNGTNGKMYGISHTAVILSPNVPEPMFDWELSSAGLQTVKGKTSHNDKPITHLNANRKLSFRLPASTTTTGKVYTFCLWVKGEHMSQISIKAAPETAQPFGSIFMITRKWKKVHCPFTAPASARNSELAFTVSLPKGANIEAPTLVEDKTGIRPEGDQVIKYFPNEEWKPIYMGDANKPFLAIKKGTALDFTKLPVRVPAGEKGHIIVNKDGKMAFEQDPDTPIRFRACSFSFRGTRITKEQIDSYIDKLCTQGYNMVRFHGPSFRKKKYCRYGVTIEDAKFIPQTKEDFDEYFDVESIRLFDYILAELGARGIYVYFDVMAAYTGFTDAAQPGHWVGKDLLGKQFHAQLYVNKAFRQNWKAGMEYLLNHTNEFNGRKWKDDPVFACMLYMNEQDFRVNPSYLSAFEPEWKKFYGAGAPKLSKDLLESDSEDGRKAGAFMVSKAGEMTKFFHDSIRATGYKGLVTQWDLYMRMIDAPALEMMQAISLHSYHGHPGLPFIDKSVPGYPVTASGRKAIRINRKSCIKDTGRYLGRILAKRKTDRPSMILEYGDTAPNPYRHEAGLFFASYCALGGINLLAPHGQVVPKDTSSYLTPYIYSDYRDPIFRASDMINAFAFLRGDVKTAKHNVEFQVTPEIIESANRMGALSSEYSQLFLLTKIGTKFTEGKCLDPIGEVEADVKVTPARFAKAYAMSVEAVTTMDEIENPQTFRNILAQLRDKNILKTNNRTDADKKIFESETGELLFEPQKGTMLVNTPRLEGAVIKKDEPVKINTFSISKCSTPAAVSMISLENENALPDAAHMLLIFSTDCVNYGMVTNANGKSMLEMGTTPLLMKTGMLSISLKNGKKNAPTVYALNLDGTRAETVKATQSANGLSLTIDTAKLKYPTPFFEVVY